MEKRIAAGYRYLYYGVSDADGRFVGSSTTAPTAGDVTGSGVTRLDGARTLPINIPEAEVLVVSGDDEPEVSFEFDPEDLPSGLFEQSVQNNDFEALVQGTKVDTTGTIDVSVLDPVDRKSQTMNLLLWRRSKSWLAGEKGAAKWSGMYIPICTIKPLGNAWEQRTFNGYGYSFNVSRSDRLGWTTVNETEHGTTGGSMFPLEADHPLLLRRWTGDNATTVYTLPVALFAGGSAYVSVNDVKQAVTTDYTIAGTAITFVAAPATDARIIVMWEVDEANLT